MFFKKKSLPPPPESSIQVSAPAKVGSNPVMAGLGQALAVLQNSTQLKDIAHSLKGGPLLIALDRVDVVGARRRIEQLQQQHPHKLPHQIANQIIMEKALIVGGSGFASSLMPGVAVPATFADLAASTAIQAEMIIQIAGAYGMDLEAPERKGEALTIFGVALGGSVALKAGLGFARNIPVAGALIGASANAAMLYAVGAAACKYYEARSRGEQVSEELLLESQAAATESLTDNLSQMMVMDEILLHVYQAGQPNKSIAEIKEDVAKLPISSDTLARLEEDLDALKPLDELLEQVDHEFAVVLIAQCDNLIEADGIITPEEESLIQKISAYLARKFQLGSEELINQILCKDFQANVRVCGFSPEGKFLVAGSDDKSIRIWKSYDRGFSYVKLHQIEKAHEKAVQALAFYPEKNICVTGGNDRTIAYWDLPTGKLVRRLESGHAGGIYALVAHANGLMASGSWDKTIKLWNLDKGTLRRSLEGHTSRIWCLAFNPEGTLLASGSGDNTVRLWNPHSGDLIHELKGHRAGIHGIAFSPSGQLLATASGDKTIRLWEVETGQEVACLEGHTAQVWQVCFTPDNRYIISSSDDKTIRIWDRDNKSQRLRLDGHTNGVYSLALSPLNPLLATGSWDRSVRLWAIDLD